jgi:hypothetical protein
VPYEGYVDSADTALFRGWGVDRESAPLSPVNKLIVVALAARMGNGSSLVLMRGASAGGYDCTSFASQALIPAEATNARPPTISRYSWDSTPTSNQSFGGTITGTGFVSGATLVLFYPVGIPSIALPSGGFDLPEAVKHFRFGPTVVLQRTGEEAFSLKKEILFWAPIFGMIVSPIVGMLTFALSWIALHRKRAEEALLYLQVRKCELEIEQLKGELAEAQYVRRLEHERMWLENERLRLEVEKMKREEDKPLIVTVSS